MPSKLVDLLGTMTEEERRKAFSSFTPEQREWLFFHWESWARQSQLIPGPTSNPRTKDGRWSYWLLDAGRGFGKTRTGAETVRKWVKSFRYVNLIGATADDARDIMVDGESGILAICPKDERPVYKASARRLSWPNGASSLIFTADEPERLRGKQHMKLWGDELGAWRYAESWDQATFGLRLGKAPQAVLTTTPRPTKLMRELINDPNTIVTRGTTYDNQANLAPMFFSKIIKKYEGTRLGRQELHAELLDDNPNSLWTRGNIDQHRVSSLQVPVLRRIVVAIDPAVTSEESSDDTGIIVAGVAEGLDGRDHFFVLDDVSMSDKPDKWAARAVAVFAVRCADRIVGEVNNGGDLVETVLRTVDPNIPYSSVHASRGKAKRAEPVAALYEQGRVHHVGSFAKLEDQMCDFNPLLGDDQPSPDRMDAMVWAITELMEGYSSPDPATAGTRTYR